MMNKEYIFEGQTNGCYLINGANDGGAMVGRNRDAISMKVVPVTDEGVILQSGTILGKVTATSEYTQVDLSASDGSEVAVGILFSETRIDSADPVRSNADVRECEVDSQYLIYPESASGTDIIAINGALAECGIVIR